MAGYTRQDTANNIANGNVIDADDFDAEYNQIESAFNASSGHVHDGTSGNGAPIEKVGPSQDLVITASKVEPKTTNTLDLGSSGVQFKNAFFDGTVDTDTLTVSGNGTVGGTLGVTGVLTATGGVVGDTTGDLTGDVTGDLTGNVTGNLAGDVTGNLTGNVTGAVTGNVTGDLTGDVTGNADTATTLETARTITVAGDVTATATSFDGSSNITLTTSQSNNSVDLGTHTTGNYVENLVAGTGVTLSNNSGEGATPTVAIGQAVSTTSNVTFNNITADNNLTVDGVLTTDSLTIGSADKIKFGNNDYIRYEDADGVGTFHFDADAGTSNALVKASQFIGALSGNASTATSLATARTIAGQSFNGTANISIGPTDLTGVNATASEINKLDGFTGTVTDLNYAKDLRATGVTATEFNRLDGLTASASELNKMDGCTATTTELNYVDGVTSNIQTQLNAKAVKAGSSSQTFSASTLNATTVDLGAWTVTQSGTDLKFAYNGTNRMKLDASGNLTVEGNVTAYGSA